MSSVITGIVLFISGILGYSYFHFKGYEDHKKIITSTAIEKEEVKESNLSSVERTTEKPDLKNPKDLYTDDSELTGIIKKLPYVARESICNCSYYKRAESGGHYLDEIFNRSCDKIENQNAIAMIDDNVAVLSLDEVSDDLLNSTCNAGDTYKEVWRADYITITLDLVVDGPGYESCGHYGKMSVRLGTRSGSSAEYQVLEIAGGCGL